MSVTKVHSECSGCVRNCHVIWTERKNENLFSGRLKYYRWFQKLHTLSRNFPFEHINSLLCYELTRRYSHLLFTQISPLTYAVYLWPVHCEYAMKHNRRQIFNYLQIRDTRSIIILRPVQEIRTFSSLESSDVDLTISPWENIFLELGKYEKYCNSNRVLIIS